MGTQQLKQSVKSTRLVTILFQLRGFCPKASMSIKQRISEDLSRNQSCNLERTMMIILNSLMIHTLKKKKPCYLKQSVATDRIPLTLLKQEIP